MAPASKDTPTAGTARNFVAPGCIPVTWVTRVQSPAGDKSLTGEEAWFPDEMDSFCRIGAKENLA
jgi:hypothetical protein